MTQYCKECKCIDPASKVASTCGLPGFKVDGNCDDEQQQRMRLRWRRLLRQKCQRRRSEDPVLQGVQVCRPERLSLPPEVGRLKSRHIETDTALFDTVLRIIIRIQ